MLLGGVTPIEQATVLLSAVPLILHMFRRSDDHQSGLTTDGRNEYYPVFLPGGLMKDAKALLTSTSGLLKVSTYILPSTVEISMPLLSSYTTTLEKLR